jgi:hypothetical protein
LGSANVGWEDMRVLLEITFGNLTGNRRLRLMVLGGMQKTLKNTGFLRVRVNSAVLS